MIGVVVGYLISAGFLANGQSAHAAEMAFIAYIVCTLGGTVIGLASSCFAIWLLGLTADD